MRIEGGKGTKWKRQWRFYIWEMLSYIRTDSGEKNHRPSKWAERWIEVQLNWQLHIEKAVLIRCAMMMRAHLIFGLHHHHQAKIAESAYSTWITEGHSGNQCVQAQYEQIAAQYQWILLISIGIVWLDIRSRTHPFDRFVVHFHHMVNHC